MESEHVSARVPLRYSMFMHHKVLLPPDKDVGEADIIRESHHDDSQTITRLINAIVLWDPRTIMALRVRYLDNRLAMPTIEDDPTYPILDRLTTHGYQEIDSIIVTLLEGIDSFP